MKKLLFITVLSIFTFGLNAQVARIGSTNYYALANAFNAVRNGETIVLLSNVTQTSQITINRAISFVVDGNEKSIKKQGIFSLFDVSAAAKVTFQNTTFIEGSVSSSSSDNIIFNLQDSKKAKLTLKNCHSSLRYTLNIGTTDTANIDGGSFSGTYLVNCNYGNLNITGGIFTGYNIVYHNYGSMNVNNVISKVTGESIYDNGSSSYPNASIIINGGTFTTSNFIVQNNYAKLDILNGDFNTKNGFYNRGSGKVIIKGGTFNTTSWFANNYKDGHISIEGAVTFTSGTTDPVFQDDLSGIITTDEYYLYPSKDALNYVETRLREPAVLTYYVGDDIYYTENIMTGPHELIDVPNPINNHIYTHWADSLGNPVVSNEIVVHRDTHLYAVEGEAVAQIGTDLYGTLKGAFSNVSDRDTIVLLKDVELGSSIGLDNRVDFVLDGNGHTIRGLANILGKYYNLFEVSDKLRLTVKNLTVQVDNNTAAGYLFILKDNAQAALHFENTAFHGYEICWNGVGDTLTFDNCTSSNVSEYLIEYNYGSVTFHSGDYTTDYSIIEYNYGTAIYEDGTYTTEYVTDYNYETALCEYHDGLYLAEYALVYENAAAATVIIQDGEYWSEDDIVENNIGMIKINNGDFHSDNNIVYDNKGTLLVHDGSFAAGNDVVRSNVGTTTVNGGEYEAQHSVVGTNTGKVFVMDGNFKSVDAACLCGTTDNSGQIFLNGGTFQGNNDGVRNGTGYVLFNGIVSFDVTNDADGVLQSTDMSAIDIDDAYLFEPSKTATGHVETILNPAAPDVARIGNVKYKTLDAAFAAAVSNDTIVLLDNITLTRTLMLGAAKNIVLDGDGYTLTADVPAPSSSSDYTGYKMIEISDALQMTVKDLTVKTVDSSKYGALFFLDNNALASLHFENTTFHGNEICWNGLKDTLTFSGCNASNVLYDIVEYNYGTVNFLNGTYQVGNAVVYENEENATLIIQNGEYTSNDYVLKYNYGTAEVNDGVYRMQEYFIEDNYGTVNFRNGQFYSEDDIVNDNYGTAVIYGGTYETDDDIVGTNEENAVLKISGGDFTSSYSLLYSNSGSALFDNVNYTSTNYYVIGNNYSTGIIQFNSGEYVSENNTCLCGSSANEGYITLRGGLFRGKDNGINNGTGEVLFDGEVTFDVTDDADGVLYGTVENITTTSDYYFYPMKDAKEHLEIRTRPLFPVYFFVQDTLYHTEWIMYEHYLSSLPAFPAPPENCVYTDWIDGDGKVFRIAQHAITGTTRLYARYNNTKIATVVFKDGASIDTASVLIGTTIEMVPEAVRTDPSFVGWQSEEMVVYHNNSMVDKDLCLTALYFHGDTVCTFEELKQAILAERPQIMLCDMIGVEEELHITANTTIMGMTPECGLRRLSSYTDGPMISLYDTLNLTIMGLHVAGGGIPCTKSAILFYDYNDYYDNYYYFEGGEQIYNEYPYDPIENRGIYAKLNLIDCRFDSCITNTFGSAVATDYCDLNIISCLFEYNKALGGGALYCALDGPYNSDINSDSPDPAKVNKCIIRESQFFHNESTGTAYDQDGGAIHFSSPYHSYLQDTLDVDLILQYGGAEIWDSEISYNKAASCGGGVYTNGALVAYRGNTVGSYNTAMLGGFAMDSNIGLQILKENVTITHNTAENIGGAFDMLECGFWAFDNVEISYNEAGNQAGALCLYYNNDYPYIIDDNVKIFGNHAGSYAGGIQVLHTAEICSGHIYDNTADEGGDDIYIGRVGSYGLQVMFFHQSNRMYGSDTLGTSTIFVDEIPGRPTPNTVSVPYYSWFKDESGNRFVDPINSPKADSIYIFTANYPNYPDIKAIWYGLLLNYDANNGSGEYAFADTAAVLDGKLAVDTNMFTYPLHKFLGWNTEPDGSGIHYAPGDTIAFTDHSQILYGEWCDTKTDTLFVTSCTQYEWNGTVYTESGIYDLYFEDAGDCDSISTLVLTLAATPLQVEITPDSHTACSNTETILSAVVNGTSENLSYVWSNDETTESITVAPTTTTSYSVIVTDEFGCEGKDTVEITIAPSYNQEESLTICQSELPYTWRDTTFQTETVTGDYIFSRHTVNGCDSIVTLHLTVNPAALDMDNLTDYIRCNGSAFSVTPTGNIPEGTLYTWTVEENANVTGQSAQTTATAAPISQMLTNSSDSKQTVVYHVTPITDDCMGDVFTITVEVEPTPKLTLTCPADIYDTLEYGSCAVLIAPEDLGTPTWAHSLGWTLIDIRSNRPADNMYPEGDNIITWTMTDSCGNTETCEQHVFVIFPKCPNAVDYEGNEYVGVRIDCDCWTQRNLRSTKYSDGTDIPGVYSYISDMNPDSAANAGTFGLLYDWESAIRDGQDNGHGHVQGICPEGWYLPTAEKYEALNAHGAAALKSPDYWIDGGGNNSTGFTSLPGGYYDGSISRYLNLMGEAYYWSTSRVNGQWTSSSSSLRLSCDSVVDASDREGLGYSVRCIKEKE